MGDELSLTWTPSSQSRGSSYTTRAVARVVLGLVESCYRPAWWCMTRRLCKASLCAVGVGFQVFLGNHKGKVGGIVRESQAKPSLFDWRRKRWQRCMPAIPLIQAEFQNPNKQKPQVKWWKLSFTNIAFRSKGLLGKFSDETLAWSERLGQAHLQISED